MKWFSFTLGMFLSSAAIAAPDSYTYSELWFHSLPESERTEVQSNLASLGLYGGFYDGIFGRETYRAISKLEARPSFNPDGILSEDERQKLKSLAWDYERSVGLSEFKDSKAQLSLSIPTKILGEPKEQEAGHEWQAPDKSLFLVTSWSKYDGGSFSETYKKTIQDNKLDVTFSTFRPRDFVVTGRVDSAKIYVRAIDIGGSYLSILAVYKSSDASEIDRLIVKISNSLRRMENESIEAKPSDSNEGTTQPDANRNQPITDGKTQTGTGFFVTADGHLLTNSHVVSGCADATIKYSDGRVARANIQSRNPDSDLAILKSNTRATGVAAFRIEPPLKLGTKVVVFGYPRLDFLTSTGNLVDGLVSALAGPNDVADLIQISAPVQSGNSGGAVLDESGKVIGVVMAKTNADPDQTSKEIFQQVNFAISADVARQYLTSQGVEYKSAPSVLKRDLTEIADEAKLFTAVVICEAK